MDVISESAPRTKGARSPLPSRDLASLDLLTIVALSFLSSSSIITALLLFSTCQRDPLSHYDPKPARLHCLYCHTLAASPRLATMAATDPYRSILKGKVIIRDGQRLHPSIKTPDEVDHRFCSGNVFSRILEGRVFIRESNASLRNLRSLPRASSKSKKNSNIANYEMEHNLILDTFCLLDYQVLPVDGDPLSQFKMVNSQGKEKLPRPPLPILIQSLRFDISALSEMLRRDLCTVLHPDQIQDQSAESLRQRFRIIRAIQNLYAEHSMMLAPQDNAFFFRSCQVCQKYDPEIIRFSRDLHCILLRILHGEKIRPPSVRYFTPRPEMSDYNSSQDDP